MKVKLQDLRTGIDKAFGIVKEKSVLEQLRIFYMKPYPQDKKLYLAGSDGSITFLSKIDAVFDENESDDVILMAAEKLHDIVKYAEADVEIINGEYLTIKSGKTTWKLAKYGEDYIDVPFKLLDEQEFDDELNGEELLFILKSLLPMTGKEDSLNINLRQIYFDGDKAYTTDGSVVSYIECKTNKPYIIRDRVAKCLIDMLSAYSGTVKLKYDDTETMVLVRTPQDVFTYRTTSDELLDIDESVNVQTTQAVAVVKQELANALRRVLISSDDENIDMTVDAENIALQSQNSAGEETTDSVIVRKSKVDIPATFKVLATNLLKVIGIVNDDVVIIRFQQGEKYLVITGSSKKYFSLLMAE